MARVIASIAKRSHFRSAPPEIITITIPPSDHPPSPESIKQRKREKRQKRKERYRNFAEQSLQTEPPAGLQGVKSDWRAIRLTRRIALQLSKEAKQLAASVTQPLNQNLAKSFDRSQIPARMPQYFMQHATGPHVTIPYNVEHKIKASLQELLEYALFAFCESWAPQVLTKNNWHSPELTELNLFARGLISVVTAQQGLNRSMRMPWSDFIKNLDGLKRLRHSAVHRIVVGERGLEAISADAIILLEAIQDVKRHAKVSFIHAGIRNRDWDKTLEILETPLDRIQVLPFYGKMTDVIDFTMDDDDEFPITMNRLQQEDLSKATGNVADSGTMAEAALHDGLDNGAASPTQGGIEAEAQSQSQTISMIENSRKGKRKWEGEVIDLTGDDDIVSMGEQPKKTVRTAELARETSSEASSVIRKWLDELPDEG